MENHNGLQLVLKIRNICCRAAAEGKTKVSPATLRLIDKQIKQLRHSTQRNYSGLLF